VSTPLQAADAARRELAKRGRPAGGFDASRYLRGGEDLRFYNVGTDRVRAIARTIVQDHPSWTEDEAMQFADHLMGDPHLEVKGVAVEVVACYRKTFGPRLLSRWKQWLSRNESANWATTDAICGLLIGPLLVAYPRLVPQVVRWSKDHNLWVRRASAVGLLPLVRRGPGLDAAYRVARTLHQDPADLIQKAVGWMLREAGKVDPARLEAHLRANGPRIPRTSVRYAIERFPPAKRRLLLKVTRARVGVTSSRRTKNTKDPK
jgi:3-methyladenine DNA glycosylase AlkD